MLHSGEEYTNGSVHMRTAVTSTYVDIAGHSSPIRTKTNKGPNAAHAPAVFLGRRVPRLGPLFFGIVVFVALIQIPLWGMVSLYHHDEHVHHTQLDGRLPPDVSSQPDNSARLYNGAKSVDVAFASHVEALGKFGDGDELQQWPPRGAASQGGNVVLHAVGGMGANSANTRDRTDISDDVPTAARQNNISILSFQTRVFPTPSSFIKTILPWLSLAKKHPDDLLTFHVVSPVGQLLYGLHTWLSKETPQNTSTFVFGVGGDSTIELSRGFSSGQGYLVASLTRLHSSQPNSTLRAPMRREILSSVNIVFHALDMGGDNSTAPRTSPMVQSSSVMRPHVLWSHLVPHVVERIFNRLVRDAPESAVFDLIVDHRVLVLGPDSVPLTLPSKTNPHSSPSYFRAVQAAIPVVDALIRGGGNYSISLQQQQLLPPGFVRGVADKIIGQDRLFGTCRMLVRDWRVLTSPSIAKLATKTDRVRDALAKLRILSDGLSFGAPSGGSNHPSLFNLNADKSASDAGPPPKSRPAVLPHPMCYAAPLSSLLSDSSSQRVITALSSLSDGSGAGKLHRAMLLGEAQSGIDSLTSVLGLRPAKSKGKRETNKLFVDVSAGEAAEYKSKTSGGGHGIASLEVAQYLASFVDLNGATHAPHFAWLERLVAGRHGAFDYDRTLSPASLQNPSHLRLWMSLVFGEKFPALFAAYAGTEAIAAGVADFSSLGTTANFPPGLQGYISQALGHTPALPPHLPPMSPSATMLDQFQVAVRTPAVTHNQLAASFPAILWAAYINDHPGNIVLSSQYRGFLDGVHVEWDTFCVRCFGFSTELLHYLRPLEHGVSIFTSNDPSKCFCPGQTLSLQQSVDRVGRFSPESRSRPLRREFSPHGHPGMFNVHISHKDPGSWPSRRSGGESSTYIIGRAMFEATTLPHNWIGNAGEVDEVWVPTRFSRYVFEKEGFDPSKLVVIPEPVDTGYFSPHSSLPFRLLPRDLDAAGWKHASFPETVDQKLLLTNFRFLSVFKWEERKDWRALVEAYLREFTRADPVSLILVSYRYGDSSRSPSGILADIRRVANELKIGNSAPHIDVISEEVSESEMVGIYRSADAYVSPTRGEGWGLPIAQALSMGLPTITTNFSGPTDFTTSENAFLIRNSLSFVGSNSGIGNPKPGEAPMKWAEPDVSHLQVLMRAVFASPEASRKVGALARRFTETHFSEESIAEIVKARLRYLREERMNRDRSSTIKKRAYDLLHQQGGGGHVGDVGMMFGGI